jgi:hypothetical protein
MNTRASERISTAVTGWVVVVLMVGWALFFFLPFGRKEDPVPAKVPIERPGEAELAAVGLRYNVDFIGLPQYFAVWADRIEWAGDETDFAYWNPGTRSYSYIIRATRVGQKSYRFRHTWTEPTVNQASDPVPESETHPFVFRAPKSPRPTAPESSISGPLPIRPTVDAPRADVDVVPVPLAAPKKLEQDNLTNGAKP